MYILVMKHHVCVYIYVYVVLVLFVLWEMNPCTLYIYNPLLPKVQAALSVLPCLCKTCCSTTKGIFIDHTTTVLVSLRVTCAKHLSIVENWHKQMCGIWGKQQTTHGKQRKVTIHVISSYQYELYCAAWYVHTMASQTYGKIHTCRIL